MKKQHDPLKFRKNPNPFWHNQRGAIRLPRNHRTPTALAANPNLTPTTFAITGKRDRDFVPMPTGANAGDIFAPMLILFLLFLGMFSNRL